MFIRKMYKQKFKQNRLFCFLRICSFKYEKDINIYTMRKKLAFIGAGSHADAVFPLLDQLNYQLVGYFDDKTARQHDGFPVLGRIEDVEKALLSGNIERVFITIGDNKKRAEVFNWLKPHFYTRFINIISNTANIISPESICGRGNFIANNAFVGAKVEIDDNCIVNTGAIVEHHTKVGPHVNLSPNSTINGLCKIGEGSYIGSSSVIIQVKSVAPWSVVGAGAVVVCDIHENGIYIGVPAKKMVK